MAPDEGARPHVSGAVDKSSSNARSSEQQGEKKEIGGARRRALKIGALALGLVAICAAMIWWLHARHYETTDDAFIDTHMVLLAPQIAGRVSRILVSDNEQVRKGQALVEIDPADIEAKLAQLQAQAVQAEKQYQQSVASAHAAEAQAENAAKDVARYQALTHTAPQAISQQQLDTATATERNTAAQVEAARAQIASAKAQIDVDRANIAAEKLNLGYTRIVAPVDGYVAQRTVAVGNYVTPGQQLMAIVPLQVWVTANFKETQLAHMRVGQPVTIDVDACPGVEVRGHVDSLQRGAGQAFGILPAENATGNFVKVVQRVPVKIVVDSMPKDCLLGPGMSVEPSVKVR